MYLSPFVNYKKPQERFQERSSVIKAKQMFENLIYGKNRFAVRKCGRPQGPWGYMSPQLLRAILAG